MSNTNNSDQPDRLETVAGDIPDPYPDLLQRSFSENLSRLLRKNPAEIAAKLTHILRTLVSTWLDRRFDKRLFISTTGHIRFAELAARQKTEARGSDHWPTPVRVVRAVIKLLSIEYHDYTFVDYGSGKGRVLILAAEFPFKQVIGVEFSKDMHDIARQNIRSCVNPRQRCFEVDSIHADARAFDIPNGPCVFYFYFPFYEDVLSDVLARIKQSYTENPRPMVVIHLDWAKTKYDFAGPMIEDLGFVERDSVARMPLDVSPVCPMKIEVFRSTPAESFLIDV